MGIEHEKKAPDKPAPFLSEKSAVDQSGLQLLLAK